MAGKKVDLKKNALGRLVPAVVNGKKQVPYQGVDEYVAKGRKAAPPIASAANYPGDGDKRVSSLDGGPRALRARRAA